METVSPSPGNGTRPTVQVDVDVLERIASRLESLEARIAQFESMAPAMAASVVDTVDELSQQVQARGIDIDERLRGSLQLLERLTAPQTMSRLQMLLEQLEQAPMMLAATVDVADGVAKNLQSRGIDIDDRLRESLALVERLTDPDTMSQLQFMLDQVAQGPKMIASVVDTFDGIAKRIQEHGIDIDDRIHDILVLLDRFSNPGLIYAFTKMCCHMQALGHTIDQVEQGKVKAPTGIFALLRTLKDPDIQRTLTLSIEAFRNIGQQLATPPQLSLTAAKALSVSKKGNS